MADPTKTPEILRVADLSPSRGLVLNLVADAAMRAQMAELLDLPSVRKLSFRGTLTGIGKRDWELRGDLGATAEQSCVITLESITTRIDVPLRRQFLEHMPTPSTDEEMEMPEDESSEPLAEFIDMPRILTEALALALPDYPRKDGATLTQTVFTTPGSTPMSDDDAKPFAGLAALKQNLDKDDT